METTLYDKDGIAVAYFSSDHRSTIYLWDGEPAAYLHEGVNVFGINGRHLGRFIDGVMYDANGARIGFTARTCPGSVAKPPPKGKKRAGHQPRPRRAVPATPELSFQFSPRGMSDLLKDGQVR